jgi:hypothetical protein
LITLSQQASALGLSRSTTWKILQADYKTSGLHAGLIGRMLSQQELPPTVRSLLREYVIEKAQDHYGHKLVRRRRFAVYFWDMPELADFLKRQRPQRPGGNNDDSARVNLVAAEMRNRTSI